MDKQFNFEQVGKRMPYNVSDGFFDQLEQNVMAEIKTDKGESAQPTAQKSRTITVAVRVLLAAAAAVALFFVVTKNLPNDNSQAIDTFELVELAYNNLSTEDQEYLMEVYEEDVFLMENEEIDY